MIRFIFGRYLDFAFKLGSYTGTCRAGAEYNYKIKIIISFAYAFPK